MEMGFRKRWPRPRFTLAVLLIVITVTAIPLGYVALRRAWNLRRITAFGQLASIGFALTSHVTVDDKVSGASLINYKQWWRSLSGDDLSPTIRVANYSPNKKQLTEQPPLSDSDLTLLRLFPEVEIVELGNAEKVTDIGLMSISGLPKLKELRFRSLPLPTGRFLGSLPKDSPLHSIEISKLDSLSGEYLSSISALPALERFSVDHCPKLDDSSLMHVTMPLTVESLSINECPIGDQTILRWLVNHRYKQISINAQMTRTSANSLSHQTEVVHLFLMNAPLIDEDFAFLKSCPKLALLHLEAMPIRGEFLSEIATPAALKQITLANTLLEDRNIAYLSRFSNLYSINLSWTPLTGEGFKDFLILPKGCELNLIGTRFTDEGMDALAKVRFKTTPKKSLSSSPMMISLPSNWSAEDFQRFDGGKPPWFASVDIFAALERKKQTGEDVQIYCSGSESRGVPTPINASLTKQLDAVIALHLAAREKTQQEEDAALNAYSEVKSK